MDTMFQQFARHYDVFRHTYLCYSAACSSSTMPANVEHGGKILMPPSALNELKDMHVQYPMIFKIINTTTGRESHCGVLEFSANPDCVVMPYWMMHNLLLDEGDSVVVENVSLPIATYSRLQPQSTNFLEIANPQAVLENSLRNFACLTVGDTFAINYNSQVYELSVLEIKPANAVVIIECDMKVDFAPPIGYQEPVRRNAPRTLSNEDPPMVIPKQHTFAPFEGSGNRLDGKSQKKRDATEAEKATISPHERGVPNFDYKVGSLTFFRKAMAAKEEDKVEDEFRPFQGEGKAIGTKKRR